jgi:hypothetical protein
MNWLAIFVKNCNYLRYLAETNSWDKFSHIRSMNKHGIHTGIHGILPKFYAIVCKRLEIGVAGGAPLDEARPY